MKNLKRSKTLRPLISSLVCIILTCLSVSAQSAFYYVAAHNGLKLRKNPSPDAESWLVLPYASQLKVVQQDDYTEYIAEGIQGRWLKVSFEDKTGFVFSGFLTPIPPPIAPDGDMMAWLDRYFGPPLSKTVFTENTLGDESFLEVTRHLYKAGIVFTQYSGYEYFSVSIDVPGMDVVEAFVWARNFGWLKSFNHQLAYPSASKKFNNNEISWELTVTKSPNYYHPIISFAQSDVAFHQITIAPRDGGVSITFGSGV